MIKLSPSILACDFSKLGEEIKKVEDAGSQYIHLDVMDGLLVPNISFGVPVIQSLRPISKMVFDTHLMITDPVRYIETFAKIGSDIITFHYESCENHMEVIDKIHACGKKAAISIKPKTPAFVLESLIKHVEMVLVMTVEPGFGGQGFIPETIESIKAVKQMAQVHNPELDIEVDGGITLDNLGLVTECGANVIVAGSSVFKAKDVEATVKQFLQY
ncbi:MAG: ribulose-phosphate 3-epimerase [Ruminococcaceae bacterium]|nr:ribulose-phosphate 3-epimerase [Oscillospiraceae bacterium]